MIHEKYNDVEDSNENEEEDDYNESQSLTEIRENYRFRKQTELDPYMFSDNN